MNKKKLLLLTTGGTIASHATAQGLIPTLTAEEILDIFPSIAELCELHTKNLFSIDSTNMTVNHWRIIVQAIEENYASFDGFIICHGTDTMAYTAAALSYMIQNLDKPVILTGSQRPLEMEISDARMNLRDAILYALDDESRGVCLVFNGKVIAGTRAKKTKSMTFDAFSSINYPELAVFREEHMVRYLATPKPERPVTFTYDMNEKVFLLKLTPGISPMLLREIFKYYDGIVVESFGVGGIPDSILQEFVHLMAEYGNDKLVVLTTQVTYEGSNIGVYQVGKRVKDSGRLLEAYDMNLEAVFAKMMWILGQGIEDFSKIEDVFYQTVNFDYFK